MSPLKENRKRKCSVNDDVLQNGVKKIKNAKVNDVCDEEIEYIENGLCEEKIKVVKINDVCNEKIGPLKNGKCVEKMNNVQTSDVCNNKVEPIQNDMHDYKSEAFENGRCGDKIEPIKNDICEDKTEPFENDVCKDKTEPVENEVCADKTEPFEKDVCIDKTEPVEDDVCAGKTEPFENYMCEDKAEPDDNDVCEDKAEPFVNDVCEDKNEPIQNYVCQDKPELIDTDMCDNIIKPFEIMCENKLVDDTAKFDVAEIISTENDTCKINKLEVHEMHTTDNSEVTEKDVHKLQNNNEVVDENIIEKDTKTYNGKRNSGNRGNEVKRVINSFTEEKNVGFVSDNEDEKFKFDESIRRSLNFDSDVSDSDIDIEAVDSDNDEDKLVSSLTELEKSGQQICFYCKNDNGELNPCSVKPCNNMYHSKCLEKLPILKSDGACPHHVCLTCYNENPKNPLISKGKMYKCFRCPLAFHKKDKCFIPGCVSVNEDVVSCFNHFTPENLRKYLPIVNLNFCVHCGCNENLLFCISCPAAVHKECLRKGSLVNDKFICDRCASHKTLRYNDVIWVKICGFQWWPAKVINPKNVPKRVQKVTHFNGEFPVQFFKTEEFFWVNTGRTYPFIYVQINVEDNVKHNFKKSITVPYFNEAVQLALAAIKEERLLKLSNKPVDTNNPPPYKHIKSNRPIGNVQIFTCVDDTDNNSCGCQTTDKKPCGYDTICLNRSMLQECHDGICEMGDLCQNRKFVKVQNVACEPFYTAVRGWGLRATEDIKKGHFVIEYVGDLIDEEECEFRIKEKQAIGDTNFYFCTLDSNRIIDAGPKGNFSRFMNHSCDPNCETQKWIVNGDPRVGIFARHDIKSGTELTFDYQMDFSHYEKLKCNCGTARCSGLIGKKPQNGRKSSQIKTVEETVCSISQSTVIEDLKGVTVEKNRGKIKENGVKRESEKIEGSESKKSKNTKGNVNKKQNGKVAKINGVKNMCFKCKIGGKLFECTNKNCDKFFHLRCIKDKDKVPDTWKCPRHFCKKCNVKSVYQCEECPVAYCTSHVDKKSKTKKYLCSKHR